MNREGLDLKVLDQVLTACFNPIWLPIPSAGLDQMFGTLRKVTYLQHQELTIASQRHLWYYNRRLHVFNGFDVGS